MLISRQGYNWNIVCYQTDGPISGRAYNQDFKALQIYIAPFT